MYTYTFTVENLNTGCYFEDCIGADTLPEAVVEIMRSLPEDYILVGVNLEG